MTGINLALYRAEELHTTRTFEQGCSNERIHDTTSCIRGRAQVCCDEGIRGTRYRGALLFGYFLLSTQEKVTRHQTKSLFKRTKNLTIKLLAFAIKTTTTT